MSPRFTVFDLIFFAACLLSPICHHIFLVHAAAAADSGANGNNGAGLTAARTPLAAPEGGAGNSSVGQGVLNLDTVIAEKAVVLATPTSGQPAASAKEKSASPEVQRDSSTAATMTTTTTTTTTSTEIDETTSLMNNGTIPAAYGADILQNRGMIARMTYVLVGFSILILVYFVVKAVRLRRVKSRTRKYGVLSENLDSPLRLNDEYESDEEVEVFEVNGSSLRGGRVVKNGDSAADRLLP